jgi:hypothetical protein
MVNFVTLLDQDWTEEQAQGLLDALNLDGGTPQWKPQHLKGLRDWCSAHGNHWETLDGQLAFVAHELCSSFQAIGRALQQSKTTEQAREVVKPYVKRLSSSEMQGLPDIASRLRA